MHKDHSFVDFYKANKVSPVSQKIDSLHEHLARRSALFRSLGITSSYIANSKILEFGPGSGYNTIVFSALNPSNVEVVEANPYGIKQMLSLYKDYSLTAPLIHQTFFEDFNGLDYDLVWAEGCIPQQSDPISILRKTGNSVRLGGSLVVTAISGVSYMSEVFRRIVSGLLVNGSFEDDIRILEGFFSPHFTQLTGMTRPRRDWIIDSLLNPLHNGNLLSLIDIIKALGNFEFIATLPSLVSDWQWYKDPRRQRTADRFLSQYYACNLSFLDTRLDGTIRHEDSLGRILEDSANSLWFTMCEQQSDNRPVDIYRDILRDIHSVLQDVGYQNCEEFHTLSELVLKRNLDDLYNMKYFRTWWGRGQSYIHLTRVN